MGADCCVAWRTARRLGAGAAEAAMVEDVMSAAGHGSTSMWLAPQTQQLSASTVAIDEIYALADAPARYGDLWAAVYRDGRSISAMTLTSGTLRVAKRVRTACEACCRRTQVSWRALASPPRCNCSSSTSTHLIISRRTVIAAVAAAEGRNVPSGVKFSPSVRLNSSSGDSYGVFSDGNLPAGTDVVAYVP
eukprot:2790582-Pleurochrysis_carterae.AAC.2